MRKLLLVLTILMLASWGLNADELVLKMGMNRNDDMKMDGTFSYPSISGGQNEDSISDEAEQQSNYSVSLEYYFDISEKFYLGFGVSFENELKDEYQEIESESELIVIPVYLTGKYKFNPESRAVFYMGLDVGYTALNIKNLESYMDEKSGVYFGGSLGMEYSNFIAEVKYSQVNVSMEYDENAIFGIETEGMFKMESEHSVSRLSLNLGYKFEI